jgi:hypothetical protein
MAQSRPRCIGMAVPKDPMAVAAVAPEQGAAVPALGTRGTRQGAIDPLRRQRPSKATHLLVVSAAGPWGDWRERSLRPKTMPAGWWPPPSGPPRPVPGSQRTVGTPCHWPAGLERVRARRALSPRWQMQPGGIARGAVPSPAALSRPPRVVSPLACAARIAATPAGPPGARPISGGSRPWAAPPGAPPCLASIGPGGARTARTPPAARTGTASARARLAFAPGGRSPAGSAGRARPWGRPQGGRPGRPHPFREPKRTEAMLGRGPCRLCLGGAAPAGGQAPSRASPGPQGAGRRRLGVPLSRPGPAPSPTAMRQTPQDAPGPQRARPRQAGQTLPTPGGPRPTGTHRHRRHGPCARGMPGGHGPTGARRRVRRQDRSPLPPQRRRVPTCLRRGAAPVWGHPRQRAEAWQGAAGLERGRHPTEARKGGANPRRAAGATGVSSGLRLCRCTEGKKPHDDLKKSCSQLLTLAVIATLGVSCCRKPERSGGWRQSAPGPCWAAPLLDVLLLFPGSFSLMQAVNLLVHRR